MVINTCPSCGFSEAVQDEGIGPKVGRTLKKCRKCGALLNTGNVAYSTLSGFEKVFFWIEQVFTGLIFFGAGGSIAGVLISSIIHDNDNNMLVFAIFGSLVGIIVGFSVCWKNVHKHIQISEMGFIEEKDYENYFSKKRDKI